MEYMKDFKDDVFCYECNINASEDYAKLILLP